VLLIASYSPLVIEAFGSRLGTACGVAQLESLNRAATYVQKPHWLDYDPVALTVLVLGIALVELLALMI
jgi:hypothetical protein